MKRRFQHGDVASDFKKMLSSEEEERKQRMDEVGEDGVLKIAGGSEQGTATGEEGRRGMNVRDEGLVPTINVSEGRAMGGPTFKTEGRGSRITAGSPAPQERPPSPVTSYLSMKTKKSIDQPVSFSRPGYPVAEPRANLEIPHGLSDQEDPVDPDSTFKLLKEQIYSFVNQELTAFQRVLSPDQPDCRWREEEEEEEEPKRRARAAFRNFILLFLRSVKQGGLADSLESKTKVPMCRSKHKAALREKFHRLFEGVAKFRESVVMSEIYTELYITEAGGGEVNTEHEVRLIEIGSRKPGRSEISIKCEDIFRPIPREGKPIRTVMTKGVAGIGKTVLSRKFTLDWAEDKTNHNIHFTFPFTFRQLNVLKDKQFSLVGLLHHFFTETKEASMCSFDDFRVVFIFDGLDECRLPLDFQNNEICTDVTESTSVDVLLTNLIKGKLLPSAHLWITTRPAAANQIPPECVDMVTEVRGFTEPQKEEYFRKRFRDEEQARRVISHIKTSRSLHIMCHIPVFCWITATVLDHVLRRNERGRMPKSLTEMYIHFLVVQSIQMNLKYGRSETEPCWNEESRKMILSLGKLAFEQLEKGNLIFYEADLTECGIDIRAASVYSGVFTQIFREECGLYQDKVFCFVHLTIQEFLAALYIFVSFINHGDNLLSASSGSEQHRGRCEVSDLHETAVDKALESPNGHLDLFLRFLLGFSIESNQTLLRDLLGNTRSRPTTNQQSVQYIQERIRENPSLEKTINLFHCLNELNSRSLVEEIQQYLTSGRLCTDQLSPAQWSALIFILLSSERELEVFDLKKYAASAEGLLRLLPVVKASQTALLNVCELSEGSCEVMASVLSSSSSGVRELDLSHNDLQDSGVELLSAGLRSPNCRLETLRLSLCKLSKTSCEVLSSVLSCKHSRMRELDLSNNDLQDSGVKMLSVGLGSPHCRLETLRLSGCQVTEDGVSALLSALSSNPYHLTNLDLSYNHPGDSGKERLSAAVANPDWRLKTLRLDYAGVCRMKEGLKKYACELTVDPNTAHNSLSVSEDRRQVSVVMEKQLYPDHPDRFDHWKQVLCTESLAERHYLEVAWEGWLYIALTCRGIKRKGNGFDCVLGEREKSWSLFCSGDGYTACHHKRRRKTQAPPSSSGRVGVYLDWSAGTLSFYRVSPDSLTHLHTFTTTFTEPLLAGIRFGFGLFGSSVFV